MEVETVGEVTVVTLPARVDTTSAGAVETEFKALLAGGARRLVADFAGNEYVSSAGLRVFLSVLKALEKEGGRMVLCAMPPFVARRVHDLRVLGALHHRRDARRGGRRSRLSAGPAA